MIALLGGLGAALCWTVSALCATAASRSIGSASTLAWVMGLGLVLIALPTALLAPLSQLTPSAVALIALAGGTNVIGLRIEYVAFRRGKVGVISAIASTEGMIAAVIALAFGAHLAVRTAAVLLAVAGGVVLAAWHPDPSTESAGGVRSAVLAIPVALLFGVSLYAAGRAGSELSVLLGAGSSTPVWDRLHDGAVAPEQPLRLTRRAFPLVAGAAAGEVVGIISYELGARHGLAVAAVLASQFAALVALGAFLLFGERLSRFQLAGLVVVAAGVGLLAAGQT